MSKQNGLAGHIISPLNVEIKKNVLLNNILRGITPTTTAWDGQIGFAFLDDGGAFTDDTTDANNATANDVPLMPAVEAVNDAFYFGENFSTSSPFNALLINIGTVGVGGTIAWEYWNGSAWVSLTVTDNTVGFTASGSNYVTWTEPGDWAAVAVNAQTRYWVRARVTAANFTTIPLATQIWCGRYPTSLTNTTDGDATTSANVATVISTSAGANAGKYIFDLGSQKRVLFGFKIGAYASSSTSAHHVLSSNDGAIYTNSWSTADSSIASTTEKVIESKAYVLSCRYIQILCIGGGSGASVYSKLYEAYAYEVGL
jgi:hypothetical protein